MYLASNDVLDDVVVTGSLFNVPLVDSYQEGSSVPFPLLDRCMRELEERGSRTRKSHKHQTDTADTVNITVTLHSHCVQDE